MKKTVRLFALLIALVMCVSAFAACKNEQTPSGNPSGDSADANEAKYNQAFDLIKEGDYAAARALFVELGDYKDAKAQLDHFHYAHATHTCVNTGENPTHGNAEFIITYNENNLPVKSVKKYDDGSERVFIFSYNESGRLMNLYCKYPDGAEVESDSLYDEEGRLVKEIVTDVDGVMVVYKHFYDESGRFVKEIVTDTDGYLCTYEHFYDENGVYIRTVRTFGEEIESIEQFYDEEGRLVKAASFDEDGSELNAEEYSYDEKDNVTKYTYKMNGVLIYQEEYTYDENGNVLSKVSESDLTGSSTEINTYDENGNLVRCVMTDEEEVLDCVFTYNLVYVPFAYTASDWDLLMDSVLNW